MSSSALKFKMDSIERKVDMSLDDIIRQSKGKVMRQSQSKIKNTNKKFFNGQSQETQEDHPPSLYQRKRQLIREENQRRNVKLRKDFVQGIISARSSAIRQGKFSESRSRNGSSNFIETKVAARQALSNNINTLSNRWLRKTLKGTMHPSDAPGQNLKIPHVSQLTNMRVDRRHSTMWRSRPLRKALTQTTEGSNKGIGAFRKLQTLDSRFATLREQRQSQFVAHPRWKQ